MYSELIAWNFSNPIHNGVIDEPDLMLKNIDPVCGDRVQVSLRLDPSNKVSAAKFQAWGCATSIAASNIFCDWITSKPLTEVAKACPDTIAQLLGELSPEQYHCTEMLMRMIAQLNNYMEKGRL